MKIRLEHPKYLLIEFENGELHIGETDIERNFEEITLERLRINDKLEEGIFLLRVDSLIEGVSLSKKKNST